MYMERILGESCPGSQAEAFFNHVETLLPVKASLREGLARDEIDAVYLTDRAACIASKPAPTKYCGYREFINATN